MILFRYPYKEVSQKYHRTWKQEHKSDGHTESSLTPTSRVSPLLFNPKHNHRQRQQKRHEMGKRRAHVGQARCPTGASTLPHVGTGDAQKMPKTL